MLDSDLAALYGVTVFNLNKAVKKAYKSFYIRPSYLLKMLSKIRSREELKRLTLAGVNVLSFSVERDED